MSELDRKTVAPVAEMGEEDTINLKELFLKLLDKWWLIATSAFLCAVLFAIYSFMFITPTYEATSKIYVVNSKDSVVNLSDFQISNYLAEDYAEVFNNWHVHESVLKKLGLDYSYKQLNNMVNVTNPSGTRIICITVTSVSPEEAQLMANTYAEVAKEFISVTMETSEPTMFEEALLPTAPSAPNKTRNTMLGFILGFVLSCAIISVVFLLDDYIRTADDVEKYLNIPVLGVMMLQDEKGDDDNKEDDDDDEDDDEKPRREVR